MFKNSKLIIVLTIVMAMCLTGITTTMAASGDAVATEEAAITKLLKVPHGVTVPQTDFTFVIKAISVDDANYSGNSAQTANMPLVGNDPDYTNATGTIKIAFGGSKTQNEYTRYEAGATDLYYQESSSLFKNTTWPHAGVYEYKITETKGNYDKTNELLTYSDAEFTVRVYVKMVDNVLKITHIGTLMVVNDGGEKVEPGDQYKLDPTPGGESGKDNAKYFTSQMIFTNKYWKHNGGTDPKDPSHWTLSVSKTVTGGFGDRTKYFDFNMTVTKPDLVAPNPGPQKYKAYIVEYSDISKAYTVVQNLTGNGITTPDGTDDNGPYINFTSGTQGSFKLRDNQYLAFMDAHVGATYTVTEFKSTNYESTANVIYNGGVDKGGANYGPLTISLNDNKDLTIPLLDTTTTINQTLYVGEKETGASFTNKNNEITTTGLNLNNLPFVGIIALALGSFIVYVVVKSTKKKSYNTPA